MATNKEYAAFILEQCDGLSARVMMGEYVLYFGSKVVGGLYDNRLIVKSTVGSRALLPNAEYQLPYEGAKEMLLVDNLVDKEFLTKLFEVISQELPTYKKRK